VFLIWSVRLGLDRSEQLRSWTTVNARVDSTAVVTPQKRRKAVYAVQYWLSYQWQAAEQKAVATEPTSSSWYSRRVHEAEAARRRGTLAVLVNPADPTDLVLHAGWTAGFFSIPLVVAAIGLFFFGFAALFYWFGRRFGMRQSAAGFIPAPARYGVWIGLVMGSGFLIGGGLAFYLKLHQRNTWRQTDARVDSADVVAESAKSGSTYSPRYWLSYRYNDSLYHYPLLQSWSSSNYGAQAKRAVEASRQGRLTVYLNPKDPLDVVAAAGGSDVLLGAIFVLLSGFCFLLAFVFHRLVKKKKSR
jgi:hypothetical protein